MVGELGMNVGQPVARTLRMLARFLCESRAFPTCVASCTHPKARRSKRRSSAECRSGAGSKAGAGAHAERRLRLQSAIGRGVGVAHAEPVWVLTETNLQPVAGHTPGAGAEAACCLFRAATPHTLNRFQPRARHLALSHCHPARQHALRSKRALTCPNTPVCVGCPKALDVGVPKPAVCSNIMIKTQCHDGGSNTHMRARSKRHASTRTK